LWCPWHWI